MATPEQSKKLLRRRTSSNKGGEKNPYSDRGVEKFSELLAEIEEKKRMIYSQFSPEEVSAIRFVHVGNNKLKPVVVRANSSSKLPLNTTQLEFQPTKPLLEDDHRSDLDQEKEELELIKKPEEESLWLVEAWNKYKGIGGVILVLLLLVVFGRYFLLQLLQATVCPRIQNI